MKIARVIEYFLPHVGGMERHAFALTQEQIKMGHQVDLYIGYGDKNLLTNTRKVPLQFLPLYSKVRRFWFNFWAARQVKKRHRTNHFDIIHLHGDFMEAYFGGKLSKKLNIPAVLTIHAGLNKKLLKPENAGYFSGIKKIICVSEEIAKSLESIGVSRDKISVISSGIYPDDFKKKNGGISGLRSQYSKPIIVSVGVLRINKGFNYLIGAFKEVLKTYSSATLLIVGDGPEKDNLIKQAGDTNQIKFLGRQDHNKVIEYLKAADIFALASVSTEGDREGTPTSIMEAMAAGLPVITTKVGGNPYLITEERNGLLVEEKDAGALAGAIVKLADDESLRLAIGKNNQEDAQRKEWRLISGEIIKIYQSVI